MFRLLLRTTRGANRVCTASSSSTLSRFMATEAAAPPLLLKMKTDLKTAMKAKDKDRLNVLRALLAEVTNAAKTTKPIQTDIQLLALLRKRLASAQDAVEQFQTANRTDLVEKELGQMKMIQEYASEVHTLSEDEIATIVQQTLEKRQNGGGQVSEGVLLKDLFASSGPLVEKPVERSAVAEQVRKLLRP